MARTGWSSSNYLSVASSPLTAVPLTMACWFYTADLAARQVLMTVSDGATGSNAFTLVAAGNVAGDPVRAETKATTTNSAPTSVAYSASAWQHAAGVWAAANSRVAYVNGGSSGSETTSRTPSGIANTHFGLAGDLASPLATAGRLAECAIWNVALTADEIFALSKGVSPLLIRPASLVRYWPLIGVYSPSPDIRGGTSLTMTGTLTAAEHPRILRIRSILIPAAPAAGGGVDVTPGVGALAATGFAPTIQTPVLLTPGLGVLTATGFAPAVQLPVNVTAGLGVLTANGFAPTVQTPVTVTTGLGAADLTGFAPTVELPVVVSAGLGAATFDGFAPTVQLPVTVTPGLGATTLTGFAPAVELPVVVSVGLGTATLSGFAPTIQTPVNVTAGLGQAVFTGSEPTVGNPVEVAAGLGQLDATGFAPTVTATAHVTVSPALGTATFSGFAPAILTPVNLSPGVGVLDLTGFAPTVQTIFTPDYEYLFLDQSAPRYSFTDQSGPRLRATDQSGPRYRFDS